MNMRGVGSTVLLALGAACVAGCSDRGRSVPAQSDAPPLAAFVQSGSAQVFGGCWLLLPVCMTENDRSDSFWVGNVSYQKSAWSGLGFAKGYASIGTRLNLKVMNLRDGHSENVFDRQVALGDWSESFDEHGAPRFQDQLILSARTLDTNGDHRIDGEDCVQVFLYDAANRSRRQASPDGYSVEGLHFVGQSAVLTLRPAGGGDVAVYAFDVPAASGHFLARQITP